MRAERGFVLVNALVLVAALSAVAVFLLARSEAGRARLNASLMSDQLILNLDAFEALAKTILAEDLNNMDHLEEAWARPLPPVDLKRGQVSGRIADLQGRFNLNWLTDPQNLLASITFSRLTVRLGVSQQASDAIRAFLKPGGPDERGPWRQQVPPLDPVGGALLTTDQLRQIPGLSERALERLLPFVSALPGDRRLNINTASSEVVAAFLPDLPPARLARLLEARSQTVYASVQEFMQAAGLETAEEGGGVQQEDDDPADVKLTEERLAVTSEWFEVTGTAVVGPLRAERVTVLYRQGRPSQIETHWRVTQRP